MPVFGKSLFETVLDGMETDEDEDEEDLAEPVYAKGLGGGFIIGATMGDDNAHAGFGHLYDDYLDTEIDVAEPEIEISAEPPPWLERISSDQVSEDLTLVTGMTKLQLKARRRAFARANHPDTVLPEYREAANIRMTLANQLLDAAVRKL